MNNIIQIILWVFSSALILFFFFAVAVNLWIAWREWIRRDSRGPSVLPVLGGMAGYAGMKISALQWVANKAWLALILDYGCLPYVTLTLVYLMKEKLFGRE
jgi:hypothetical protein